MRRFCTPIHAHCILAEHTVVVVVYRNLGYCSQGLADLALKDGSYEHVFFLPVYLYCTGTVGTSSIATTQFPRNSTAIRESQKPTILKSLS
jgi:hypothetical protein